LLLLDIAQRLSRRRPGVPFYVTSRFASEDFRARFLAEVDRRTLTDIVQVLPYVRPDEIMSVLGKATIAITPNLRVTQQINGVHTKLFEYMAAGLPIVASDLPHQVKVVGEEGVGLLAKPEDPESFVKCIEELLDDREKAVRLGRRGREVFREKYSWESQMPQLRKFYKAILAGD
jgi:glycosyltransferase involved in cell wall biosynthesis